MTHGRTVVLLPQSTPEDKIAGLVHKAMLSYIDEEYDYYDMVSIDEGETVYKSDTLPENTEAEAVITPDGKWHRMFDYIDTGWDSKWGEEFISKYPDHIAVVVYTSF